MRPFVTFIVSFLLCSLLQAGINVEEIILEHNNKIKQLIQKNKLLKGIIEELEENQKINAKKIEELFFFIEYKMSINTDKKNKLDIKNKEENSKKIYESARKSLISADYDKAIELFTKYIELYPKASYANDSSYWLAKSHLAKGDYEIAQKSFVKFKQSNSSHPKFINVLYELVRIYINLNANTEAKETFELMVKNFPKHNITIKAEQLINATQIYVIKKLVEASY